MRPLSIDFSRETDAFDGRISLNRPNAASFEQTQIDR